VIGCSCKVCRSNHPHDNRSRSSIFFEGPWGRLLIDSGPDLRQQALREQLTAVDAVLYTHEHLDHVAGFDELRAFCWKRDSPLPLYGSPETLAGLARMYPWAFSVADRQAGYIHPEPREIEGAFFSMASKSPQLRCSMAGFAPMGFASTTLRLDHLPTYPM